MRFPRRFSLVAVGVFVAAIAVVLTVLYANKKLPKATAVLKIDYGTFLVRPPDNSQYARQQMIERIVAMLKSPLVLGEVVSNREAAIALQQLTQTEDVMRWLRESLEMEVIGKSQFMEVSLSSRNEREAAIVVNAVVRSFVAVYVEYRSSRESTIIQLLGHEVSEQLVKVEKYENEIRKLARSGTDAELELRYAKLARDQHWEILSKLQMRKLELDVEKRRHAEVQLFIRAD